MDIKTQTLAQVASYFSMIAHTNGRLRVRVSTNKKVLCSILIFACLDDLFALLNGIIYFNFKIIIGSVTIEYDHEIFPKNLWEDLLKGQNLEEISAKVNEVAREVKYA